MFPFLLLLSFIYLLLAHTFIPNLGGVILHPREYLLWIVILLLVAYAFSGALLRGKIRLPPGRKAFLLFIFLSLLSAPLNPMLNRDAFLIQSVHLFAIYAVWLALNQFRYSRRVRDRILLLIFLSAGIEAIIGLLQFMGYYRFIPVTPLVEEQQTFVWGAFQQKNLLGSFLALGGVASFYLLTAPVVRTGGPLTKFLLIMFSFLISTVLVFANSRIAWIGFLAGLLVVGLTRFRFYKAVKLTALVWACGVVCGLTVGVLAYGGLENYRRSLMERESSNAQRILMLKTSWEMFREKPLTGHGFGNFESLYMRYQAKVAEREKELRRYIGDFVSHPHNEIANVAVQSGILGLAGLFLVSVSFLRMLLKLGLRKGGLYAGLLSPLLFHTLVEFPLELSVVHYFTFVLLLSLISSHLCEVKSLHPHPYVKVSVLVFTWTVFTLSSLWLLNTFKDYMRMVLFVVETEKGRFRPELMEGAVSNLYLKDWAVPLLMLEKAKNAMKEGDEKFLKEFIVWSEAEKVRRPIPQLFIFQASALAYLGKKHKNITLMDESMKVIEDGLRMYPNNRELKKLKGLVVANSIRLFIDYLKGEDGGKI